MKAFFFRYNLLSLSLLSLGYGVSAQKNSGIFYSTLFAKQKVLTRIQNFGDGAGYCFFKDINGDGRDDAIAIYTHGKRRGKVYVALSDSTTFRKPVYAFTFIYQFDFAHPVMGDINGDGRADIVYVDVVTGKLYVAFSDGLSFSSPVLVKSPTVKGTIADSFLADWNGDGKDDFIYSITGNNLISKWYVAVSNGKSFNQSSVIADSFGSDATQRLTGDVNGDGKADLIAYYQKTGALKVALSDGEKCLKGEVWLRVPAGSAGTTDMKPLCMAYDIDKDGKDDIIVWDKDGSCNWSIAYSSGRKFVGYHLWISDFLKARYKNNITVPRFGMTGTMDGDHAVAMTVSRGKWLALGNIDKVKSVSPVLVNTWDAWGNDYIPDGGTYDAGDPQVNDRQIKQIYHAGFTYIMLDITNGHNDWVDNRAKDFIQRVRLFDQHLDKGEHKIYVNISLGHTRGITGKDNFFKELNRECERAWKAFYLPYKDIYYRFHGKPLVVHMITTGWKYLDSLDSWNGDKTYISKFANRWMDGTQGGADKDKPNTYGWIVPGINTVDKEMMPVMPGFWNGITGYGRDGGALYRQQWMRIIKYSPESVWVNSFNETWEHTSVEPSYHMIDQFVANPLFTKPWTDYYGDRMDDFYWIMTKQYNQLFMNDILYVGSYFQEYGDSTVYKVKTKGIIKQSALPVMAPVLLLPAGFRKHFKGNIIKK
ncbi:MAG TPA: FG-GAP-like repeat-containing protein [Chitinophagaceae bacterium]|nr:FG-GAP-like repeat-containing protein [Chitinophagaceae bacterium]